MQGEKEENLTVKGDFLLGERGEGGNSNPSQKLPNLSRGGDRTRREWGRSERERWGKVKVGRGS